MILKLSMLFRLRPPLTTIAASVTSFSPPPRPGYLLGHLALIGRLSHEGDIHAFRLRPPPAEAGNMLGRTEAICILEGLK